MRRKFLWLFLAFIACLLLTATQLADANYTRKGPTDEPVVSVEPVIVELAPSKPKANPCKGKTLHVGGFTSIRVAYVEEENGKRTMVLCRQSPQPSD